MQARQGALRGLFSGGTLADEAMLVAGAVLGDIRSNIPLRPELALPVSATQHGRPTWPASGTSSSTSGTTSSPSADRTR